MHRGGANYPDVPRNQKLTLLQAWCPTVFWKPSSSRRGAGEHCPAQLLCSALRGCCLLQAIGTSVIYLWAGYMQNCLRRVILTSPRALAPPHQRGEAMLSLKHKFFLGFTVSHRTQIPRAHLSWVRKCQHPDGAGDGAQIPCLPCHWGPGCQKYYS